MKEIQNTLEMTTTQMVWVPALKEIFLDYSIIEQKIETKSVERYPQDPS